MIPVDRAVQAAVAALPQFLGGRRPDGVRVEEVLPPKHGAWSITLSYLEPGVPAPEHPLQALPSGLIRAAPAPERVLKVITVDCETGEAKSMTLRKAG